MQKRNPKYYVNFCYSYLNQTECGELEKLLISKQTLEHLLCILSPVESSDWLLKLDLLKPKGKMFIKIFEKDILKILKIQRT